MTLAGTSIPPPLAPRRRWRTRADALREGIAEGILKGEFEPGQRLDEHSLAQQFGVSRTPVREALKQLAAMQLVDLRPHRGAVVAGLTPGRVAELFEAMGEVEAACARLAALKMSSLERERLETLAGICDRAMVSGSLADIDETNRAFHASIHDGSHNGYLSETAHALRLRLAPFSRVQFGVSGRPSYSRREHALVLAAVLAGDGDAAEAAMRRHLASVGRAFLSWLAEVDQPAAGA